jgi:oligoendopeptidase F
MSGTVEDRSVHVQWSDFIPVFNELQTRPLSDVESWLSDWSVAESSVREAAMHAKLDYFREMTSDSAKRTYSAWAEVQRAGLDDFSGRLSQRLLESGQAPSHLGHVLSCWERRMALSSKVNHSLQIELAGLRARYLELKAKIEKSWNDQPSPGDQLGQILATNDREAREKGFRARYGAYAAQRDLFADVFDAMLDLRQRCARNAGYNNYAEYAHASLNRFSYSLDDCTAWNRSVEEVVVPAAMRAREARRLRMNIPSLRPWDLDGFPDVDGRAPLTPFRTEAELSELTVRAFGQVDGRLGEDLLLLQRRNYVDLMARDGKATASFCAPLDRQGLAFVLMSGVGADRDLITIGHEVGHAFRVISASRKLPLLFQREVGSEVGELAAMSMELLFSEQLGSIYGEDDFARAQASRYEQILDSLTRTALIDSMQQWIYTDPAATQRRAREDKWTELAERYQLGVDWKGLEDLRSARWYVHAHFFLYPFHYIEYGFAQLAALRVWLNSRSNHGAVVDSLFRAFEVGGTRTVPDVFRIAGTQLFMPSEELCSVVEQAETLLGRGLMS